MTRDSAGRPNTRSVTLSAVSFVTSVPQASQTVWPTRAKSTRRWSWISVAVATVERGFREGGRCRIATAGQIPSRRSTAGFSIRSRNWRA